MPVVSMKSDLHPYECGQNCVHCTNATTGDHSLVDCSFCWEDLLRSLDITDFEVPLDRQLRSHGAYDVMHGGQEYTVFAEGRGATEYLKDEWVKLYSKAVTVLSYRFKLTGAHGGPPIEVLMIYPRDEPDGEGGQDLVWDFLLWADDHTPFDHDYFLDAYTDPLRDELTEIAKGWD
jgi:hypothetical protein